MPEILRRNAPSAKDTLASIMSQVQVVKERSSGAVFAMKVMRKADILKNPDVVSILEERDIMAWTTSPWLTSMKYSFQDSQHLYIVMDFFPGGDLFSILEKEQELDEDAVKFYLAEIASGLHDLHQLGFVHRDVKPENVLIAQNGHVRLVDFGVAARVKNGKVVSSQLPVGTPSYLAPEVLRSLESTDGYGVECDWWSLGIVAYELMVGVTPFEGDNQKETYDNIMNYQESLQFPEEEGFELSDEFQDLIRKLCTGTDSRLGFEGIKLHSFFAGVNWDHLLDATPPYIPELSGPDDTSHFEEIKPQGSTLLPFKTSRTQYGFNWQSLHFVGFTHSKFPPITAEQSSLVITSQVSEADIQNLRQKFSQSEEERRRLDKECAIYQSQLEDLHRQLEMEKLDRRSTDAKTLQLLTEVKQQGRVAQEMKESETKNTVESLQKIVDQMEQDQAVMGKKIQRLQESVKSQKKEAEQSKGKSGDLEKKLFKLKGTHQKELSSLQSKLLKVTKDGQDTISDLRKKLTQAEDQLSEANRSMKQLKAENNSLSAKLSASDDGESQASLIRDTSQIAMEGIKIAELELRLESQKDDLDVVTEELKTAKQKLQDTTKQLQEMDEQAHLLADQKQKLDTEQWNNQQKIKELTKMLEETAKKAETAATKYDNEVEKISQYKQTMDDSAKEISQLKQSRDLLQKKVKEFENNMSQNSSQQELVRAVQKRNKSLEEEYKELSTRISELNAQLQNKEKEMVQVREDAWKEKAAMIEEKDKQDGRLKEMEQRLEQMSTEFSQSRSTALDLRKKNRELEKQLGLAKDEVKLKTKRLSSLNQNLEALSQAKSELLSVMEKRQQLEAENKTLKSELLQYSSKAEEERMDKSKLKDLTKELKSQLEAEKLANTLLQNKLDSTEADLEAARSTEKLHEQEESSWSKARKTLESDLDTAESQLDKTKVKLDTEKKARQQAEAKLKQVVSQYEAAESVRNQEIAEWKEKFEQTKVKAKEYSELLLEVKQRNAVLEVEAKEVAHQLEVEKQLSSKLHDQFYSEHRDHNILKATHMKLVEKAEQDGLAQDELAKLREQQLQQLRQQATEQTKMQVTIAQQSKLIDYLQDKSPTKPKSKLRKGLRKIIKRSRDPAKEMEDWNKFKGFLTKKSTNVSSPTGSASMHIGKSPSISSVSSNLPSTRSMDRMTASPSTDSFRSTRSASTTKESTTTPLREVTLKQCQVNLSRHSSAVTVESSATSNGHEWSKLSTVTSPKRKKPPTSMTMGIEHNIPHKFSGASISIQSANCASCKTTIKRGHKNVKCKYCKVACHPKCAANLPNTCGLPAELADHVFTQPPSSKKAKMEEEEEEEEEPRKVSRKEGWLQVFHPGVATHSGNQEWVVVSEDSLCCYTRMDIGDDSTRQTVKAILLLKDASIATVLHTSVKKALGLTVPSNKHSLLFALQQYSDGGENMTYFVPESAEAKKEWISVLESVLEDKTVKKQANSKNLKEVAVVPIGLATPLMRTRSATSKQSHSSTTSSLLDDTS
ncbi:citron Rho-interacting kinase-like isoform X2 [Dysidea avara]|uniref:citron Rho-interacting kinase-like isoform X2 n=1 Tax=Dysidea avara TaxID=196820 RepID=UPI00332E19FA